MGMLILVVAEKHSGRLSEEEGTLGKMCPPKKLTLILKSLKKENLSVSTVNFVAPLW